MKKNTLRCYGHVKRMPEDKMVKKVYQSSVDGRFGRGRPSIAWEGRVEQYLRERVGGEGRIIEEAKRARSDRAVWRLFCYSHRLSWELPVGTRWRR